GGIGAAPGSRFSETNRPKAGADGTRRSARLGVGFGDRRRGRRRLAGVAHARAAVALWFIEPHSGGGVTEWTGLDVAGNQSRIAGQFARRIKKRIMLNYIWLGLILLAVIIGGCNHQLKEVTDKAFEMAEFAVMKTALPLVGIMALWLGIMRLAERAGLVAMFARALRPLLRWLFPDVPPEHPAMGSMVLNIAAGILG